MFDSIGDMPLHPLVVHAVVVGAPLAALLGFLFVVPRFRAWSRWPLALVAVGAFAASLVAKESGEGLQRSLGIGSRPATRSPADRRARPAGDAARRGPRRVRGARRRHGAGRPRAGRTSSGWSTGSCRSPLVVVGVLVLVWCYRVGDIGSRAVWNPTGTQTY